jgi:SPP1 gp7 family putative phage head morphogenesis protein
MRLAALQHELACECCAQRLDVLHDVIRLSDVSIAKALMISDVAQIARTEMRMRDYLLGKWRNRAKEAAARAGAVVSGGGNLATAYAAVDKVMGKWASEVESRAKKDLENVYYLARKAGWKKGTGKTKASLQYIVPNLTESLEAGDESVAKARKVAEVLPSFDLGDEKAVADLQADQMLWIGRHYGANLRDAVRQAVEPGMIKGIGHDKAGVVVRDAVAGTLGKVVVPEGFSGSDAKYFEGIAANVSTNARVRGQIRSFSDIGITKYEIVNPMDERTTPICRTMNGKVFEVKQANDQIARTSAAKTPADVKSAHPWLGAEKVSAIFSKGGTKGLAKAGLALPPYHFRCRSTVDVSTESMSFDRLAPEAPEAEPKKTPRAAAPKQTPQTPDAAPKAPKTPKAPPPIPPEAKKPRVPSTRLGDIGEKVFGKRLTDAEIEDLAGLKAKLPPDHRMVVTVRESEKHGRVTIGAGIMDKKNNVVGTFGRDYTRDGGKLNVHHAAFFLDKKVQNAGIGREIFNAQIDAYMRHGVDKVRLEAAEVGKYVWTKAGFEWTNPEQIKKVFDKFTARLKREVGAEAAAEIMTNVKTPQDLSRVVVGKKRIGKDFLIQYRADIGAAQPHLEMSQTPARIKKL